MERIAMTLLHYNIQFVAGEIETYHREVRETFSPLLDLLANHPAWKFNVELQGHMVEFMAENYPHTLAKLKKLVDLGQVELISCHYSDQIWIAFPKKDMVKSIELNDGVLAKHGLKRSRIFFSQENFSGEGLAELAPWFDVCVMRSCYYTWFQPIDRLLPYYTLEKLKAVIGPDAGSFKDLQWRWSTCADGEPINVSDLPVNTREFFLNPRKMADFEQTVAALERDGYAPTTIGDFVARVDKRGFAPEPLGPIADGAWHMEKCLGPFQWMGRYASDYEDDCVIRSHNVRTRNRLLAAETLIDHAKGKGVKTREQERLLQEAWRHQLLGEVSDSTGWVPTPREVHYAIEESDQALNIVQNVVDSLKLELSLGLLVVDTETGTVSPFAGSEVAEERLIELDDQDTMVALFGAEGTIRQFRRGADRVHITVDFVPTERFSGVSRPFDVSYLQYSPALMEHRLVRYDLDRFRADKLFLPLTNGLITVRENLHVIKHNEHAHIACTLDKRERTVRFQMENAPKKRCHWEFTLFWGSAEEALIAANRINVTPKVVF